MKWYVRELVNSKTYQLASTGDVEAERPQWLQRARTRPLSAEELIDAWRVATNYVAIDEKAQEQLKKDRFYPLGEYQRRFFGQPADGVGNFLGGLHEHLYMNNGGMAKLFSRNEGGLLHSLAESKEPIEARVERLYLSILTRRPTPEETEKFAAYLGADSNRPHDRVREAMWVLMSCSEFRFNH